MTAHQHHTRRDDIASSGHHQPPTEVLDAYNTAAELTEAGWQLKRLHYDAHIATATVVAQSPHRRVVTVHWDLRGHRLSRQQVPNRRDAMQLLKLAHDIAHLGCLDAESGSADLLTQLCWLVQGLTGGPHRHRSWRRTDALPTLPHDQQPRHHARAAAWLIARLVAKYGWHVTALGQDIAAGGFIAEIPADVLAVFPAAMAHDGTAAAELARILAHLEQRELTVLARLDYRALWAADHTAGAGQ